MATQADRTPFFHSAGAARGVLSMFIAGITVILLSTAGFARVVGWGPSSTDDSGDSLALDQTDPVQTMSEARANARCAECGMIVSMRTIEGQDEGSGPGAAGGVTAGKRSEALVKSARRYEIIVRMADGSTRVIGAANPARWRAGERLIVIAGTNPSHQ